MKEKDIFERKYAELCESVSQAEKKLEDGKRLAGYRERYTREARRKRTFTAVILILLIAVIAASLLLGRSEPFMEAVVNWLTESAYAPEAQYDFWMMSIRETMEEIPGVMEQIVVYGAAAGVCLILATIGGGFAGFALVFVGFFVGFFTCGSGLYDMAYLCILCPGALALLRVALKLKKRANEIADEKKRLEQELVGVKNAEKELEAAKKALKELEEKRDKANALYQQAMQQKDDALMEQAAALGHEAAAQHLKKQKEKEKAAQAEKVFQEATAGDTPDMQLLQQAAKLGHPLANLQIGKEIMEEATGGLYTGREREAEMQRAAKFLHVAAQARNKEAELLELACRIQYESNGIAGWKEILKTLRQLKKSSDLPENCRELCDELIRSVVGVVDSLENQSGSGYSAEPKVTHTYCAYCNSGICTKHSTGAYLAHCDYMNDPGKCATALMDNGLRFEFE